MDTIEAWFSHQWNILEQIEHAQGNPGVIVFTDPDFPVEKIRRQSWGDPRCPARLPIQKNGGTAKRGASLGVERQRWSDHRRAAGVVNSSGEEEPKIAR